MLPAAVTSRQRRPCPGYPVGLPAPLKVLWTIWGAVVSVNLVVWVLVSATTAQLIYPWPLWVAGPWGAVLLAVSVSVTQARRGGQPR